MEYISRLLRCPSCLKGSMCFTLGENPWAQCIICKSTFSSIDGIPFLTKPNVFQLINKPMASLSSDKETDVFMANLLYHNQYADKYENVSTIDIFDPNSDCQRRIEQVLKGIKHISDDTVMLDICCGTGNILKTATKYFDYCFGIDISINMMNIARQRNLIVLGADVRNIPLVDECIDCVTAFSSLHHIYDYLAVIHEIGRILKPGGFFYSDWDPNGHVAQKGWAVSLGIEALKMYRKMTSSSLIPESIEQKLAEFHHHTDSGFSGELVKEALQKNGFSNVQLIYHINPPSFEAPNPFNLYYMLTTLLKAISFIPPTKKNIMPWVAILAIK
jgi:ubiquinone/menaquinone biosynthesis C-methylase UbiE